MVKIVCKAFVMKHTQLFKASIITGIVIVCLFESRIASSESKKQKGNADAGENAAQLPCFLAISDVHIDTSKAVTKYGDETGMDLWNSTTQKISTIISTDKPTFIILLGDLPWHAKRDNPAQLNSAKGNTGFVLQNLRKIAVASKIPLLYVPGNNDSQGGDYDAFTVNGKTPFMLDAGGQLKWPMITGASSHNNNDPSIADSTQLKLGCYSAWPLGKKSHLRVIALNSVIFVNDKAYSANATDDAAAEINWFKNQLIDAVNSKDFVLIAMHVPPGKNAFLNTLHNGKGFGKNMWDSTLLYEGKTVQDAFLDIVSQYKKSIIGILGSHTHMDGIKILTDKCGGFSNFLISVPSITPDHLNNPGMKIISYDPSNNFSLVNFVTYYYAIGSTAQTGWENSYSFDGIFNCPQNTPIREYIQSKIFDKKDTTGFLQDVKSIYTVKSIMPNDNDMKTAVKVDHQKEHCTP